MTGKRGKRPGIRQVATESGYSITTVSMALNRNGRVNEDTRRRIVEVAQRLGYVPNAAGKALKSQRSETVGLLFYTSCASLFSNAFYVPVLDGIEEALSGQGYNLLIAGSRFSEGEARLPKCVLERSVDGMILLGRVPGEYVLAIGETGVPLVAVDQRYGGVEVDTICSDGFNGARAAVKRLVGAGHERIGMLTTYENTTSAEERFAGYAAALKEAGIAYRDGDVFRGRFDHVGMMETAEELLKERPPVTALFAVNDSAAISALSVFSQRGVRVPGDFSLVGFDDIETAKYALPPLTTMAVDKEAMGRIGAETLLARIEDPKRPVACIDLPVSLVERASVEGIAEHERIPT